MKTTYTREEVILLLLAERNRAVKIADEFKDSNKKFAKEKQKAGNKKFSFVYENIAEECRLVGNAICGLNALSITLGKTREDLIKEKLDKYDNKAETKG